MAAARARTTCCWPYHRTADNRAAASELYKLIGGRLYGVAQRILHDPGLAEDAAQEGFLKIWKNA